MDFTDLFAAGKGSEYYADTQTLTARLTAMSAALEGAAVTSSSSVAPATGTLSFTTDQTATARPLTAGATVRGRSVGTPAKWFVGTVTSFSGTALVVNATLSGGSGAATDWLIGYALPEILALDGDPAPRLSAALDAAGQDIQDVGALGAATATVSTLLTVSAGMQSGALYLGDASGDVVIEAEDAQHIYCTIVGDTTFLVAGGTVPGTSHDHLIHWTMGGAGGYAVTILPLAQNTYSRDYQSTAEAGGSRPWVDDNTSLAASGTGSDGRALTKLIADATGPTLFDRYQVVTGLAPDQALCLAAEIKDAGDGLNIRLFMSDSAAVSNSISAIFNPSTGAIVVGPSNAGNATGADAGVVPLSGGGFLVWISGTPNTSGSNTRCQIGLADGSSITLTGDGVSGALFGDVNIYSGAFAGIQTVGATRAGQVVVQGTATDFPAMAAAATGDLGISIEPDGRIVTQDHTVEEL